MEEHALKEKVQVTQNDRASNLIQWKQKAKEPIKVGAASSDLLQDPLKAFFDRNKALLEEINQIHNQIQKKREEYSVVKLQLKKNQVEQEKLRYLLENEAS